MCLPLGSRGGPPASEPESSAPILQHLHYPHVRVCVCMRAYNGACVWRPEAALMRLPPYL